MKVITWNVNSIRTRLDRAVALLDRHAPDLLCLQETKVQDADFPVQAFEDAGYVCTPYGQKTYNGVAFLSREPLKTVHLGFADDPVPEQKRVITVDMPGLTVMNVYVVNGQALDSPKFAVKMKWLDSLAAWLHDSYQPTDPVLVVGDFNIAPEERDVHDPEKWRGKIHFTAEEHAKLALFTEWGLEDLFRMHEQGDGHFSWWDYRMGAFARGWGLRIDLALGTKSVAQRCTGVEIDREERKVGTGEGKPSDHAPVIVHLKD